ncbi:MAG: hypothetical protein LBQ93_01575 [Treponema sp.]|jgi:hypothetical protein|nr:hypothetical protein [Treponema sp.]
MQRNKERRFYTPQFSGPLSGTVRRYSWALGLPMTKAMFNLVSALPAIMDPEEVCLACKDKDFCKACFFGRSYTEEEKAELLSRIVSA